MFNRKTVFILGAGASWHYGYPTGEELVRKVIAAAASLEITSRAAEKGRFNHTQSLSGSSVICVGDRPPSEHRKHA